MIKTILKITTIVLYMIVLFMLIAYNNLIGQSGCTSTFSLWDLAPFFAVILWIILGIIVLFKEGYF